MEELLAYSKSQVNVQYYSSEKFWYSNSNINIFNHKAYIIGLFTAFQLCKCKYAFISINDIKIIANTYRVFTISQGFL